MAQTFLFDDQETFLARLRELRAQGKTAGDLRLYLPWAVTEVEEILDLSPGGVRFFAVLGGLSGFLSGLALTIYSVTSWPIIVGGKPIVSMPPFLLISYILTILFGGLLTFAGFIILARLPSPAQIRQPEDFGNRFAIVVREGDESWRP